MEDNNPTPNPPISWRSSLPIWLDTLKKMVGIALAVAAVVGVTFVYTGSFSARAYSDRLFIGGILVTFIGVFIFITIGGTRRNLGIPAIAKNTDDARKIMDHTHELSVKADQRYNTGSQVWGAGIICLVLSILLYYLLNGLGI